MSFALASYGCRLGRRLVETGAGLCRLVSGGVQTGVQTGVGWDEDLDAVSTGVQTGVDWCRLVQIGVELGVVWGAAWGVDWGVGWCKLM